MAVMAFICAARKLPAKQQRCYPPSDILKGIRSTNVNKNSLDKLIARQIDCSTNDRSLNAKFAVKLHVRAVCEARPLKTPAFI